jgi:hypothetical protein
MASMVAWLALAAWKWPVYGPAALNPEKSVLEIDILDPGGDQLPHPAAQVVEAEEDEPIPSFGHGKEGLVPIVSKYLIESIRGGFWWWWYRAMSLL